MMNNNEDQRQQYFQLRDTVFRKESQYVVHYVAEKYFIFIYSVFFLS